MTPELIAAVASLIATLGPLGFELFTKLEGLLNLGSDTKANIANAIAASNTADADTIAHVTAWMTANGFKPQVSFVQATAAPVPPAA